MQSYKFKVVLLGEGRVGKTSILLRYVENKFSDRQTSTIQASYLEKTLNLGNSSVKLAIWDTAGQERFHALAPIYYRDANAAILVFDITDTTSFKKVTNWVEELKRIVGLDNISLMLAANKCDLENKRQVPQHVAQNYAQSVNATLVGTSAKTAQGIEQLFLTVTRQLLEKERSKSRNTNEWGIKGQQSGIRIVDDDTEEIKKGCCNIV